MRRTPASITLFLLLILSGWCLAAQNLVVHFIDVGQGDAALVQFPNGKTLLVDGGPTVAGPAVVAYLREAGVSRPDAVVSSHPHEDHIGGLSAVLDAFPVGLVVDSGYPHATQTYEHYLRKVDQKNIRYRLGRRGLTLDLDPAVAVRVLWPMDPLPKEINDSSIVLKLTYGSVSFLFAGDVSSKVEPLLDDVKATVIKQPHHGSASSGSLSFLRAVKGKIAIISVGAGNSYGHPTVRALSALATAGYRVYRTDLNGTVKVITDGKDVKVETLKKATPPTGPPAGVAAPVSGKYVGSSKSNKFHYDWCRYAKAISLGNLVVFKSKEAALEAGYVPCKVCKP